MERTPSPSVATLKDRADSLRANATPSELIALTEIKKMYAFENQLVFGFFILDFVIPQKMLIVEIDGGIHRFRAEKDQVRDEFCRARGMKVLRVPNGRAHLVLEAIASYPDIEGFKRKWANAKTNAAKRTNSRRTIQTPELHAEYLTQRRLNRAPRKTKRVVDAEKINRNEAIAAQIRALEAQLT